MSIEAIFEGMKSQAATAEAVGGSIKFMIDESPIFINGNGDKNEVSQDDAEADCTITCTADVFEQLSTGDLNPMMAVMGGKVKIAGDMGLAMKLQSLLG